MRRLVTTAILICLAIAACAGTVANESTVRVYANGRAVKLDPPAMLRDGRAYVGLRGIAKALGGTTKWDAKTKTAIVTVGNKRTRVAHSKGITIDNVLFLPLRATGEAVGCTVKWDGSNRAVRITSEPAAPKCYG